MTNNREIEGEYFFHPDGFILAIPADSAGTYKLRKVINELFLRYGCLFQAEIINSKRVIRLFDGLPKKKKTCLNMLDDLCKSLGVENLDFSGDLVAYDTSGKLMKAMNQPLTKK